MSDTDAAAPQVRRPLVIVLAVLVIAALAYVLIVLPNQGGGVEDFDQTQAVAGSEPAGVGSEPGPAAPTATPEAEAGEEPTEGDQDEPSFEVFDARDPFDQLVVDDAGAIDDTQDTTTTTPAGDTDAGTTTPAGDGAPVAGEPAHASVSGTTIRLDEVFDEDGEDRVIVQVGDEGYESGEGDTVAGGLEVLDIADSCATMRFDDTRFILCEGEQIRK